jgi:chloramphenicol O-acetyltransferase type A
MKEELDIDEWARKDHFHFFNQFDEPFFGVCVDIDCTRAYKKCKNKNISFFLYYLHKVLIAANTVEPFRYRIEDNKVYKFDKVHASPTINRPDGTFGFAYMDYYQDFQQFSDEAQKEIKEVKNRQGLNPAVSSENVIHFSSLPWINFNAVSHARNYSFDDSCPKISIGKITEKDGVKEMPVSIHVHHGLMDGYHVSQFIEMFQKHLKQ